MEKGDQAGFPVDGKKGILLNQIFGLFSVCRHNGWFSLETLTAGHFLLWEGPVQIRGNWFNGFGLMAQKAVDTFLFSFFCFLCCFVSSRFVLYLILFVFGLNFVSLLRSTYSKALGVSVVCVDASACSCCRRQYSRQVFGLIETDLGSIVAVNTHSLGHSRVFN